uniref:Uncharacterized protein n=1 Tax=Arundo donax TaxID=35708 RepID=A0A0A9EWA5_ARUDO
MGEAKRNYLLRSAQSLQTGFRKASTWLQ